MNKHTYMDNIVSIPQQPPYNPSAMAVLTQAAQTIRQNAIVGLAHNQLKAIARMQEQLEPILRIQKQFAYASAAMPALTAWANSLRLAADPLQEARSMLQGMSSEQARIFASRVYGPQMTEAIRPALVYLGQLHPEIYREIAPEPQPSPSPSTPPQQKKKARRRALAKAARLTSRTGDILRSLDGRIQSIPSGKLSNILSLLLGAGSIAPPEYAHSINLLCFAIAALLTFHHKE
ncbi:hypothetical protein [uncultured Mitsuokella sp.]|uniref:hypothetical protein n=1 Tax=uncultured Mitsuokella sp. TaxID=453120 RepID=UPI00267758DE|nr:hypothetical protein [uncultured Mitsuokella sp.]